MKHSSKPSVSLFLQLFYVWVHIFALFMLFTETDFSFPLLCKTAFAGVIFVPVYSNSEESAGLFFFLALLSWKWHCCYWNMFCQHCSQNWQVQEFRLPKLIYYGKWKRDICDKIRFYVVIERSGNIVRWSTLHDSSSGQYFLSSVWV